MVAPGVTETISGLFDVETGALPVIAYNQGPVPVKLMFRFADPPVQIAVLPLTVAMGNGLTVILTNALPVQPFPSLTVTAKVPAIFTEMVCVVAPPDQL